MGAGYGPDLAEVHHGGFGHIAREAASFVLGMLGPGPGGRTEGWRGAPDWAMRWEATRHGPRLRRDITLFRRDGEVWRRTDEQHVLRLYPEQSVATWLEAAGFRVALRRSYGATKLPGWAVFVARRRTGG